LKKRLTLLTTAVAAMLMAVTPALAGPIVPEPQKPKGSISALLTTSDPAKSGYMTWSRHNGSDVWTVCDNAHDGKMVRAYAVDGRGLEDMAMEFNDRVGWCQRVSSVGPLDPAPIRIKVCLVQIVKGYASSRGDRSCSLWTRVV
jgi:hypothetical protein